MSKRHRILLAIGMLLIIATGIYPPWQQKIDFVRNSVRIDTQSPIGYHLIFRPPSAEGVSKVTIDFARLGLQWFLVVILIGGLMLLTRSQDRSNPTEE